MSGAELMETTYQALARRAAATPDATFLAAPRSAELPYSPSGFRMSYGKAAAAIERVRSLYAQAGYGHGVRVALLLENRPSLFIRWLALNGLGAAILPLNRDLGPADLKYQLALGEPDLIVALPETGDLLRSASAGIPVSEPREMPPPC